MCGLMAKKLTMKGLFKPKARSPLELVKHMHELLMFLDRNMDAREQKRKEKVWLLFWSVFTLLISYCTIVFTSDPLKVSWDSKLRPQQVKALFYWARPVAMLCNLFDIICHIFLKKKKRIFHVMKFFNLGLWRLACV